MDTTQERTNEPVYRIGTRGSLLALTQCLQMKQEMEEKGLGKFELKIIRTQGDENTQAPLWQLDGKDFFTKELDEALLKGEVDLVVHSYKDLGSERPEGIKLATITERHYPHDILFIKKETVESLKKKEIKEFVVGTSSPRRMTNIESSLAPYLPFGEEQKLSVTTKSLRGNVNTRLEKLLRGDYHAIVLALPGIERLAVGLPNENNEAFEKYGDPKKILGGLIKDLTFMVLPTSAFPAAASQGALAIECREDRGDGDELLNKLKKLNDPMTIKCVAEERKIFQSFGGGCHLAVGINVRKAQNFLRLDVLGKADEKKVQRDGLLLERSIEAPKEGPYFLGIPAELKPPFMGEKYLAKVPLPFHPPKKTKEKIDYLISSGSALNFLMSGSLDLHVHNLWSSGTRTMKKMAAKGLWCHGSADSLGEEELQSLRDSALIKLFMGEPEWIVATNKTADSPLGDTLAVYDKKVQEVTAVEKEAIESANVYYWTSFNQYESYKNHFKLNPKAIHACGLGKTYKQFKNTEKTIMPFASMKEFSTWLGYKKEEIYV